jgi:Ner family transcriptional regulator
MTDWHPEDIKSLIRKRGETIASLAREGGMTRQALGLVLGRPGERGEDIIAAFLNVDPQLIWPSRYHRDGRRKKPQPPENYQSAPRFAGSEIHA